MVSLCVTYGSLTTVCAFLCVPSDRLSSSYVCVSQSVLVCQCVLGTYESHEILMFVSKETPNNEVVSLCSIQLIVLVFGYIA